MSAEAIKKGDFIKLEYTGSIEGKVFDTSLAEVAKKANLPPRDDYVPLLVRVGHGDVVPGLEDALVGMKKGDEKKLNLPPEKAYGPRNPELVKLVPLKVFKENKITPVPGMVLNLDNMPVKVQSVSGGRVRVDMNHKLAGKTLDFDVKIVAVLTKDEDKIQALADNLGLKAKISIKDKQVTVQPDSAVLMTREYGAAKAQFIAATMSALEGHSVEFKELFENKKR